jgi:hypothetical protein
MNAKTRLLPVFLLLLAVSLITTAAATKSWSRRNRSREVLRTFVITDRDS